MYRVFWYRNLLEYNHMEDWEEDQDNNLSSGSKGQNVQTRGEGN